MKTYTTPTWAKVFCVAFCIAAFVGAGFVASLYFTSATPNIYMSTLGPLALVLLGIGTVWSAWQWRATISDTAITLREYNAVKELLITDIEGYTKTDKQIIIKPKRDDLPTLKFNVRYTEVGEITRWINTNLINLDQVAIEKEEQEILHDEAFGNDTQERKTNLGKATKVAQYANGVGIAIALWTFLYPHPYGVLGIVSLLYPLVTLAIYKMFDGRINLYSGDKSIFPSIGTSMYVPISAFLIRILLDFDLLDYQPIFKAGVAVALILMAVFMALRQSMNVKHENALSVILMMLLMSATYGYSSTVYYNCYYDGSPENTYTPKVVNKHTSSGKHTSYYLKLEPWGNRHEDKDETVAKSVYNETNVGDQVNVYVFKGKLGAQWYEVIH